MRNLQVDGLTCRSGNRALDLQGFENAPIYDVRLSNCSFGEIKNASVIKNVRGLELRNVTVSGKRLCLYEGLDSYFPGVDGIYCFIRTKTASDDLSRGRFDYGGETAREAAGDGLGRDARGSFHRRKS